MLMRPMDLRLEWTDLVAVRLLRRWVAAREAQERQLPSLVQLADRLGYPAELAVAMGSLFQITEGCLGRPLRAESCCSPVIGVDERAILTMLAATPEPGRPSASTTIPHGLPGALIWAAAAARRALGAPTGPMGTAVPATCPFEPGPVATV